MLQICYEAMTEKESSESHKNQLTQVKEEDLLKSISKTHSVFAVLQSFGLDILLYGAIYIAGSRKMDPIWMIPPILALVIKDTWSAERERRQFAKIISTLKDEDNQLVFADTSRIPPWVYFPDVERCNWLNNVMIYSWPIVNTLVVKEFFDLANPVLNQHMKGLKLRKFSLGQIPPTISGIKVYDKNVSCNRLIVDATLNYSGDCELEMSFFGVPVGIENIQLRGPARINFRIIETLPFIAGVDFSFLEIPEIDFVLTGVLSLGYIEEALRVVAVRVIRSYLLFPKKFSPSWAKVTKEPIHEPEGVIRLNVVEAKNLESKYILGFIGAGSASDPYAEVVYGSRTLYSRIIDNNDNPYWDLWCEFVIGNDSEIKIRILDKDFSNDDYIGRYSLSISDLKKQKKMDSWVQLENSKGSMHIKAYFIALSDDFKNIKYPPKELSFLSPFLLTILVKSAQNLLVPSTFAKPSSSVQLSVGNDTQETSTISNNNNPIFGEQFHFFVNNPDFNKLRVKVVEDDEGNTEIGSFSYSLRKLLDRENFEIIDQFFPLLDSALSSTIIVSMRLRVIKNNS